MNALVKNFVLRLPVKQKNIDYNYPKGFVYVHLTDLIIAGTASKAIYSTSTGLENISFTIDDMRLEGMEVSDISACINQEEVNDACFMHIQKIFSKEFTDDIVIGIQPADHHVPAMAS